MYGGINNSIIHLGFYLKYFVYSFKYSLLEIQFIIHLGRGNNERIHRVMY
jgi:hypothetical protein